MHNWLVRNLSLLGFLMILAFLAYAGLALVPLLRVFTAMDGPVSFGQLWWGGSVGLLIAVVYILAVAIAYGLFLRFLALCDDIAAIRRHQTGKPASLD